jgi:hypothetical protein
MCQGLKAFFLRSLQVSLTRATVRSELVRRRLPSDQNVVPRDPAEAKAEKLKS